jgi:hydrogenase maturation protein HypF
MICRQINCPLTSSVGRLFDAVAALLGVFARQSTFEGQPAMAMETAAVRSQEAGSFPFALGKGQPSQIDWGPMIDDILLRIEQGENLSGLARRFHAALAEVIAEVATRFDQQAVVLSGGCFQNATLLGLCRERLERDGRSAYWPRRVPLNDGGLAVGQALAATRGLTRKG